MFNFIITTKFYFVHILNLSRCTLFIFTKDKKYAIVAFLNDYSKGKLQVMTDNFVIMKLSDHVIYCSHKDMDFFSSTIVGMIIIGVQLKRIDT